ncbi:hypothetical protein BaRGS_00026234 [Batillaria attramentaria]|uniref:Uncharacterized protein n=1 Tax=Batillaria attramentaria TaxID=370345 RepID=A0ABD0K5Z8_9CAEN
MRYRAAFRLNKPTLLCQSGDPRRPRVQRRALIGRRSTRGMSRTNETLFTLLDGQVGGAEIVTFPPFLGGAKALHVRPAQQMCVPASCTCTLPQRRLSMLMSLQATPLLSSGAGCGMVMVLATLHHLSASPPWCRTPPLFYSAVTRFPVAESALLLYGSTLGISGARPFAVNRSCIAVTTPSPSVLTPDPEFPRAARALTACDVTAAERQAVETRSSPGRLGKLRPTPGREASNVWEPPHLPQGED